MKVTTCPPPPPSYFIRRKKAVTPKEEKHSFYADEISISEEAKELSDLLETLEKSHKDDETN